MDTQSKRDSITEQVSEASGQVKAAVADFGRKTVESLDAQRGPAAVTLERTASVLHRQTENVSDAVHATADTLDATADYVRTHDMKAMAKDVDGAGSTDKIQAPHWP